MAPRFLKEVSNEISMPVALIFRKSLDTGQVPRDWRNANITPLFKHGNRSKTDNYRPVSLTSQICKIVESVLRDKLVSHLDKYELLQPSQHGFRSGFSCGSNLLSFLETVTSLVDAKESVDAIYLDLAKAFDKVPHNRLLLKDHRTRIFETQVTRFLKLCLQKIHLYKLQAVTALWAVTA